METADALRQQVLQVLQQTFEGVQAQVGSIPSSAKFQELAEVAMQQWLAAASCAACLVLLLSTIAAGWFVLWHTTMKDVGFFRELMGLNKPKPHVKAQMQAERAAEIERIKRQHSRSGSMRSRAA